MLIKPIKTRRFRPPKDDLWELLAGSIKVLKEDTVVAVASKIVSIGEGRCVLVASVKDKDRLIIQQADKYLPREMVPNKWAMHTLKNNIFMPSAGIDESNAAGHYILWPKDAVKSAQRIWKFLREKFKIKNLGVLITDSRSMPLRRGVVGVSLAHWGFAPLKDYRGKKDIFGKELVYSQTNMADGLAAAAVVVMGEGNEQTPLALITKVPFVRFSSRPVSSRKPFSSLVVPPEEDIYRPFWRAVKWRKGGGGERP
ncbi:MAG: coenzyme F420-0:L-glutamate ligase [Patescibacteria group bacterium]